MAEFPTFRDEEELDALEGGDQNGLPDLDLAMNAAGSGDFHTKNDPRQPYQRPNVVQRDGSAYIKCKCVDVIHGKWAQDSEDKASLIVLSFRFNPRKAGRRVTWARLSFRFFDMNGDYLSNPAVTRISLDDSYSLVPSKRTEETTVGTEGTAGGGALGLNLSGTMKWEQKVQQETTDAAYLFGSIDRHDAPYGPENSATWILMENGTLKKGIPASLRVGILVKRETDEDFKCTVQVDTKADTKTRIEELFSRREADDAILFKTSLAPTNQLLTYDRDNLGSLDLRQIEDVTFITNREDAIKSS